MNKQDIILIYFRNKRSKICMFRKTGFTRKIVDKYINDYESSLLDFGIDCNYEIKCQELIEQLMDKPKYKSYPKVKLVVTDALFNCIKFYLEENKRKNIFMTH